MEEWKAIDGYYNLYQISNYGNVNSLRYGIKRLKQRMGTSGYWFVTLVKDKKQKHFLIHRLVFTHFIAPIDPGKEVNHIDLNKSNNAYSNLEQLTHKENSVHAFKIIMQRRNERMLCIECL